METTKCKLNPELVKKLDKLKIDNIDITSDDGAFQIDLFVSGDTKFEKIISKYFPKVCAIISNTEHYRDLYGSYLEDMECLFTDEAYEENEVSTFLSFASNFNLDKELIQALLERTDEIPSLSEFCGYILKEYLKIKMGSIVK